MLLNPNIILETKDLANVVLKCWTCRLRITASPFFGRVPPDEGVMTVGHIKCFAKEMQDTLKKLKLQKENSQKQIEEIMKFKKYLVAEEL